MPPLHLIGFARLACGCLVARYHQPAARRNVEYIEEKGCRCSHYGHRRDQPLVSSIRRRRHLPPVAAAAT